MRDNIRALIGGSWSYSRTSYSSWARGLTAHGSQPPEPQGECQANFRSSVTCCPGRQQAGQQAATHLTMVAVDGVTAWNRAPRSDILRCVRPRRSTSWVTHTRTWEALVSWLENDVTKTPRMRAYRERKRWLSALAVGSMIFMTPVRGSNRASYGASMAWAGYLGYVGLCGLRLPLRRRAGHPPGRFARWARLPPAFLGCSKRRGRGSERRRERG